MSDRESDAEFMRRIHLEYRVLDLRAAIAALRAAGCCAFVSDRRLFAAKADGRGAVSIDSHAPFGAPLGLHEFEVPGSIGPDFDRQMADTLEVIAAVREALVVAAPEGVFVE